MKNEKNELVTIAPFGKEWADLDRSPLESRTMFSKPVWKELRTYLAVAKCKSYAQAAEMLGTSPPTVSRDVNRLQDLLGVQLVITTHTGIILTDIGKKIALEIAALDYQLSTLSGYPNLNTGELIGRVSISVTSGLAIAFVAPSIPTLSKKHPNIQIDMREQVSLVDFEKNQSDIVVSLVPVSRADVTCVQIGTLHLVPVASREYILTNGEPDRNDLHHHKFLQCNYYASDRGVWKQWSDLIAEGTVTHKCENSLAYYSLVKCGAGIGLLGNYALADPLLQPVRVGVHVQIPIFAISLTSRLGSKLAAAVFDWLTEVFASNKLFGANLTLPTFEHSSTGELLNTMSPVVPPYSN